MSMISRRDILRAATVVAAGPMVSLRTFGSPVPDTTALNAVRHTVALSVQERFQSLPFESQQIDGLLGERMRANVHGRLLHMKEEAALADFVRRFEGKGDIEGDWLGEHVGKFLDAACDSIRYQDNVELRRLVDRMAKKLISTQAADGYLGTYAPEIRWKNWDVWTHKYNLIGLLQYFELSGDPASLEACRRIGDLLVRTFGEAPGMLNIVESGEHAGMAACSVLEAMCKLYRFTAEPRYLEFCQYVVRAYDSPRGPRIVSSLLDHGSVLRVANAKVYEMLSNFNGLIDLYLITGDEKLLTAVLRAWADIVQNQLYCTGTMSAGEQFVPNRYLLSLKSSHVGETCVNVTWLQLNWRLLRLTGESRFAQEIERTLYNHMLAAQDRHTGNICYYTPLAGKKEYTDELLCCVSSGPRGIALIPKLIWGLEKETFVIHQYTAGEAAFDMNGVPVRVRSQTRFPMDGYVALTVNPARAIRFALKLRVPEWAQRFEVKNGSQILIGMPGGMLVIDQMWRLSHELTIQMDMSVQVLPGGPGYPDYIALKRGPQVLAMETELNAAVPFLHRVSLVESTAPAMKSLSTPTRWSGQQLYEIGAAVGVPRISGQLHLELHKLQLVPFADAVHFRVWLTRAGRARSDVPAVTAFARGMLSEQKWLPEEEFLTDENPATFATSDPRDPRRSKFYGRSFGERGGPVWFGVLFDDARAISRIVFRHGANRPTGGWFDTSVEKPKVQVLRTGTETWEEIATLDAYPRTDALTPPGIVDGHAFEVRLNEPLTVRAIRVEGRSGGDYASCGELAAYA